jgi:hypothetical protein
MLTKAAENLAGMITEPTVDNILPNPLNKGAAAAVAAAIR